MITTDIIFLWTGTNAAIPAGWARVTSMDGKYPKGTAAGVDPNVTGGADTHSHTSPNHTHTMGAHTHSITINASTGGVHTNTNASGGDARQSHAHNAVTSGAVTGASIGNTAATYAAISNDPPYYSPIFIKPTIKTLQIPDGVAFFWDNASLPSNFIACDGAGGSPDLRNKYLKGAAGGADAGGTGGSTTNIHGINHFHTQSHSHLASAASGNALTTGSSMATGDCIPSAHTHTVTLAADSTASNTDTINLTTSETVEPAHKKLMAVINKSGSAKSHPTGVIALFIGLLSAIPKGWVLCDGNNGTQDMRDKHLKICNTSGELGNTGGSNTHTHGSQTHSHTAKAHTGHTSANLTHAGNNTQPTGSGGNLDTTSSVHSITTGTANFQLADGSTTADSSNNEPSYRTVAFIKNIANSNPAAFFMLFVH